MTFLGVDYGTKRIGLATGDPASKLVFPLRSVERTTDAEAAAAVLAAAREESAERIVVGVPRPLRDQGGPKGETEAAALAFAEALRAGGADVATEDERLTSDLVERWRRMSGTKKDKFDKDAAAAAAILESYIERLASRPEGDRE